MEGICWGNNVKGLGLRSGSEKTGLERYAGEKIDCHATRFMD
jgi:hypothetical protein